MKLAKKLLLIALTLFIIGGFALSTIILLTVLDKNGDFFATGTESKFELSEDEIEGYVKKYLTEKYSMGFDVIEKEQLEQANGYKGWFILTVSEIDKTDMQFKAVCNINNGIVKDNLALYMVKSNIKQLIENQLNLIADDSVIIPYITVPNGIPENDWGINLSLSEFFTTEDVSSGVSIILYENYELELFAIMESILQDILNNGVYGNIYLYQSKYTDYQINSNKDITKAFEDKMILRYLHYKIDKGDKEINSENIEDVLLSTPELEVGISIDEFDDFY